MYETLLQFLSIAKTAMQEIVTVWKSEVLETTVLSVYTTDLEKLIKKPPPRSGKRYQITDI